MVSNAKSSKSNNNETLRFYLVDFKNCKFIKKQMKYFYKKPFNKNTVLEIENYQVFLNIMESIIEYIDKPNSYNRHVIKYLVSKFKDSEELLVLYEFFPIIIYLKDRKLAKVLLPLTRMLEKNEFRKPKDISYLKRYLSSDDSESETDQDYLSSPIEYNEFNEDEFIEKENEEEYLYEYLNNENVIYGHEDEDEEDIVVDEDEDEDEEDIVVNEDEDNDIDEVIDIDEDEDEDEDVDDNDIDEVIEIVEDEDEDVDDNDIDEVIEIVEDEDEDVDDNDIDEVIDIDEDEDEDEEDNDIDEVIDIDEDEDVDDNDIDEVIEIVEDEDEDVDDNDIDEVIDIVEDEDEDEKIMMIVTKNTI